MTLSGLFRLISSVISIYMVFLFIRILLTWFRSVDLGKPFDILVKNQSKFKNPKVAEMIKKLSRLKYGKDQAVIEAEINQRARL